VRSVKIDVVTFIQLLWFVRQSCVTNVEGGIYVGGFFIGGAVPEMEACWLSSVVLRGRALNHPVLRWLKTVVVL
jgi:hypothetical protein